MAFSKTPIQLTHAGGRAGRKGAGRAQVQEGGGIKIDSAVKLCMEGVEASAEELPVWGSRVWRGGHEALCKKRCAAHD